MTFEDNHTPGRMVTHISDDRFREIALSASHEEAAPLALSIRESEHFHNCEECIDRLGHIARQIFKERLAGRKEQ